MSEFYSTLERNQKSQRFQEKKQKVGELSSRKYPILKRITPNESEQFLISETLIQTQIKLQQNSEETYTLRLKDEFIIFYLTEEGFSQPLFYIELDFNKLFSQVLDFQAQCKESSRKPQDLIKGFKIIDQNKQEICFYIRYSSLTKIWIRYLSKFIIQTGFQNEYKPVKKLGKGGSASVYQVVRIYDGERFAAKCFPKQIYKNNSQKFNSFINEINIIRSLQDDDNIIKFHSVYETDTSYFIIMDNLVGGNLLEYLMKRKSQLKIIEIKTIMRGLIKGLIRLEENQIIHRDLKLDNLMLKDKDCISPVIVDFGLAVYTDQEDYIYYKCGTPGFISPEILQTNNKEKISTLSDIFSAGVIFHILLMGKYVFTGKDPKEIYESNKKLNINLNKLEYEKLDSSALELLKKMLSIDVNQRLSASQCLDHPFLKEQQKEISPVSTASGYSVDYHF